MTSFAFFGSDSIAIPVLEELEKAGFLPSLMVCSPDKPKGRGLKLTSPPAKVWAEKRNIRVLQPEKLNDEFHSNILTNVGMNTYTFGVVASYGKIIPQKIIDLFPKGLLNVHPSLLPKLRGPSPIESAILSEEKTGVTIIKLDAQMDHGAIVAQREVDFAEWPPYYKEAEEKLGREGGKLLAEILPSYLNGKISAHEQDHSQATFTKKFNKEDGLIDLTNNSEKNLRKIRAFSEWPGAYFFQNTKRIKIKTAHIERGELKIDRVIPESKKETDFSAFSTDGNF